MQRLPLKHARRRLDAFRDEHGVPHIAASSWRAALYGLGYLHAIDRTTQMLFARAMASGRSAELIADTRLRELFAPHLDRVNLELLRRVKIASQLSNEAIELITDLPRLAGSNAWAVSPSRSATGHALLASDPHLEVNRLPAIWYEA